MFFETMKNFEIYQKKIKKELEPPRDIFLAQHSTDVLSSWESPEFEVFERDKKWYLVIISFLVAVITYAIFSDNPIMAITFILIGIVGYIYIQKEPRILNFMITQKGIVAGKELYPFENLKSFWIFYEPGDIKVISFFSNAFLAPYIQIPLGKQNPVEIRKIILKFLPEKREEPSLSDLFQRLLHL